MNNQFKLQINSIFKSRKRTKNTKFESFIFPILLFFFFFSNFHENTYQSIRKIRITSQTFQLSASLLPSKKIHQFTRLRRTFYIPPFHFQKHISRSANINIHHLSSFHFQKHVPAQDHEQLPFLPTEDHLPRSSRNTGFSTNSNTVYN